MDARQARALLELIADLYTVANTPEPKPEFVDLNAPNQKEQVDTSSRRS